MSNHTMSLRAVETIPASHSKERTSEPPMAQYQERDGYHVRVRNKGYDTLIRDFASGEYGPHALVHAAKRWHPGTIYQGLLSARRTLGLNGTVDVIRRGDRVYLSVPERTVSDRAAWREATQDTLIDFDSSGEGDRVVPAREDIDRLYAALQYRRTRLGLGHVRIEKTADGVRLVNTMVS